MTWVESVGWNHIESRDTKLMKEEFSKLFISILASLKCTYNVYNENQLWKTILVLSETEINDM